MPRYQIQQLTRDDYAAKMTRTAPLIYEAVAGREARPLPDNYTDFARVHESVSWLYAGIGRIAQACARIPIQTFRLRGKEEEDASDSELAKLLDFVNPRSSRHDLIEGTVTNMNVTGNYYWELARGERSRLPKEIWPLKPDRVRVKADKETLVGGYFYTINRKETFFEPEDIVHFKFVSSDDHYGVGPLKVAINAAVMELEGAAYNRALWQNWGMPGVVLHSEKDSLHPDEEASIARQWREKYAGAGNAGKLMILRKGRRIEPLGLNPDQLQWIDTRKMTREEIGAIIGVPPIMMGLYEGVNYATADQQEKMFYSGPVSWVLGKIEGMINEFLAPQFEPNLRVRFDMSGVECLQEDKYKESDRITGYVDRRILTPNMALQMLHHRGLLAGLDTTEVPGGDIILVPVSEVPVDEAGMLPPADEDNGEGDEKELFGAAADYGD